MKPWFALTALLLPGTLCAASVGKPAPTFKVSDSHGKTHALSDYKGKYIVLEWHNQGCPFVKKHYDSGNMQKLQKEFTKKGVVWFSVISSAQGKQGHVTPTEADAYVKKTDAAPTAVLLDGAGTMGKQYGAKTTPHMFVVDPKGTLIYDGAIDDKPSTDLSDVAGAKNYVTAALNDAQSGKQVSQATTTAYGCSVKYGD